MITVVAALIHQGDHILICQRRRNAPFALKWEFPGGKVKDGESLREALVRELKEEMNVIATVGPEVYRTAHRYAEQKRPLELIFFAADTGPGQPENLAFEQMVWCEVQRLVDYDFLPADRELIRLPSSGQLRLPASTR